MKTINYKDKTIHIVSTAHVSAQSVIDVKEAIDSIQPEVVCVELDHARAHNLMHPQGDPDIKQIIKSGKVPSFVANLLLSSYQKRMADDMGTEVGGEMKQAILSAKEHGIPYRNIDRDVQITFKRIWQSMGFFKKANLMATLAASALSKETVEHADIEALKNSDLLYESVKELDDKLPEISHVLLHERNYYMAEKVKALNNNNIVVVLGAAHTQGFIEAFDSDHDINDLVTVKKKQKINYAGWIIPIILVTLLLALTFDNPQMGLNQIWIWFLLSSGSATLATILLRTHPLTSLVTLVSAPIGTLSPILAVGMFASLTESVKRPPHVSDFETLSEDVSHFKKWFSNRVLRLLLIFIITNLLSSIGTFIALGGMLNKLL